MLKPVTSLISLSGRLAKYIRTAISTSSSSFGGRPRLLSAMPILVLSAITSRSIEMRASSVLISGLSLMLMRVIPLLLRSSIRASSCLMVIPSRSSLQMTRVSPALSLARRALSCGLVSPISSYVSSTSCSAIAASCSSIVCSWRLAQAYPYLIASVLFFWSLPASPFEIKCGVKLPALFAEFYMQMVAGALASIADISNNFSPGNGLPLCTATREQWA